MTANTQVSDKYKETEIGIIPKDWEVCQLKKLISFTNGKAHEQYISDNGQYIVINSKFISTEGEVKKFSDICIQPVNKADITMVMSDVPNGRAIAKCFFVDKDNTYTLNQRICSMRAIKDNSKYLFLQINRNPYYLSFDDGVKQTNLRKKDVLNCLIKLPKSIGEQRLIAKAITDIDDLIFKLNELIEKKRNIKQGAMQELLTGKKRLPGFNGEWEKKKLGEMLAYEQPTKYLVSGIEYDDNNTIPVLTAGKTFILGYTDEETGIFNKLPTIIFDDFTTVSKYVDFPFKAKSSAMKMLNPRNSDINLRFVFEIMQLLDFTLGNHKRYWISEYQNIEVDIPEPNEQNAIATASEEMERGIQLLEKQRDKYIDIKQGMMQQLLTGKIRLI